MHARCQIPACCRSRVSAPAAGVVIAGTPPGLMEAGRCPDTNALSISGPTYPPQLLMDVCWNTPGLGGTLVYSKRERKSRPLAHRRGRIRCYTIPTQYRVWWSCSCTVGVTCAHVTGPRNKRNEPESASRNA